MNKILGRIMGDASKQKQIDHFIDSLSEGKAKTVYVAGRYMLKELAKQGKIKCTICQKLLGEDFITLPCHHIICVGCGGQISYQFKSLVKEMRLRDNPLEYYITPTLALERLRTLLELTELRKLLPPESTIILEPTDANAIIGNSLRKIGYSVSSSDLKPRKKGVLKRDFFDCKTEFDAIVFNPPFSEFQKNQKWMKQAFKIAPIVIALLPNTSENGKTFKRFGQNLHTIFVVEKQCVFETAPNLGKSARMRCRWYVWHRDRIVSKPTIFQFDNGVLTETKGR